MSDPFVAEIRIFTGSYVPAGWAPCDGQIMAISQNTALFALLSTTYGGDGVTTFALPDLRGRAPMHHGRGPGLTERKLGDQGGAPTVTLTTAEMPVHTHQAFAGDQGDSDSPAGSIWTSSVQDVLFQSRANTTMSPQAIGVTGSGQSHNNMQPYLGLTFIIALQGIFPSRS
jgi:microcystin-dependent protein